jgi:hypothetical protein
MEAAAILQIVAFATQYGIPAAQKIIELLQKKDATIEDVKAAFAAAHKSYEEYEALPEGSTVPALPKV